MWSEDGLESFALEGIEAILRAAAAATPASHRRAGAPVSKPRPNSPFAVLVLDQPGPGLPGGTRPPKRSAIVIPAAAVGLLIARGWPGSGNPRGHIFLIFK